LPLCTQDAATAGEPTRTKHLLGRMDRTMMDETRVKTTVVDAKPTDSPAPEPTLKSRFDDAEYARWSEKLRAGRAKGK
jgi:hypothetical protein